MSVGLPAPLSSVAGAATEEQPHTCFTQPDPAQLIHTATDRLSPDPSLPNLVDLNCRSVEHMAADGHPVARDGSQDADILRCMDNILTNPRNYTVPADPGHLGRQINRASGKTATIIYRVENPNFVVTMFTNDGNTGNWSGCASGL